MSGACLNFRNYFFSRSHTQSVELFWTSRFFWEVAMAEPTKSAVRRYIAERVASHKPIPTQDEIRRLLGWGLVNKAKTR